MSAIAARSVPQARTMLDGDFTVITVPGHAEADVQPAFQNPGFGGVTVDVFRHAMRKLPGGVVMVTTRIGDRPWGLTISSCCSMTADPPQILISLQKRTASYQQILHDGCFGIGILGPEHRFLAELGSRPGVAKFIEEHCHDHTRERLASPVIVRGSLPSRLPGRTHALGRRSRTDHRNGGEHLRGRRRRPCRRSSKKPARLFQSRVLGTRRSSSR